MVLDSDWELFDHALQRLHDITQKLPRNVRVVNSRLLWDDGRVMPSFVPPEPVGYEERIRWMEDEGTGDKIPCMHRSVFETTPYFHERRGTVEILYELELARNETILDVEDVLGMEHADAPHSYMRSAERKELIPRLFTDASDLLWMAETTLERHGEALEAHAPHLYRTLLRLAMLQAFLTGDREKGLQYGFKHLRLKRLDALLWPTLILGIAGPRAVAHGVLVHRVLTSRGAS